MRSYGQYCPVARTSELLAERWTPILIRNLLNGCRTFSEIRQGAPGIPTALLAQRLVALERSGIVSRTAAPSGRGGTYELTEMGRELRSVTEAMGQWGARWLEIQPHHVDPAYVLWATLKSIDVSKLPDNTIAVRFALRDEPSADYWMLLRKPAPELCTRSSGHTEDLVVHTDSTCLIDLHMKRTTYDEAVRGGRLSVAGPSQLARDFISWIKASPYADISRAVTGR